MVNPNIIKAIAQTQQWKETLAVAFAAVKECQDKPNDIKEIIEHAAMKYPPRNTIAVLHPAHTWVMSALPPMNTRPAPEQWLQWAHIIVINKTFYLAATNRSVCHLQPEHTLLTWAAKEHLALFPGDAVLHTGKNIAVIDRSKAVDDLLAHVINGAAYAPSSVLTSIVNSVRYRQYMSGHLARIDRHMTIFAAHQPKIASFEPQSIKVNTSDYNIATGGCTTTGTHGIYVYNQYYPLVIETDTGTAFIMPAKET